MESEERARDLKIAAEVGVRIREARNDAGLTQEALAEAAGLHPTFVSNLERGYRVPSVVTILKVARALKTTPGAVLDAITLESG